MGWRHLVARGLLGESGREFLELDAVARHILAVHPITHPGTVRKMNPALRRNFKRRHARIMASLGARERAAEISRDAVELIGELFEFLVGGSVPGLPKLKQYLDRFARQGLGLPSLVRRGRTDPHRPSGLRTRCAGLLPIGFDLVLEKAASILIRTER